MNDTGSLKIVGNSAYQHVDNGGIVFTVDEFGLTIEASFFGYGHSSIQVPFFNKDEFIKFLQQLSVNQEK